MMLHFLHILKLRCLELSLSNPKILPISHTKREEMVTPSSHQILIGISLDLEESKELLSWAIRVLAHPNDTIVALHVLVGKETKKRGSIQIDKSQFRRAKAFVISVLGEFATTCQSMQVNLEAKVQFSSSIGKGLIEDAKTNSADFLLLGGSRNKSNRYCFEHAPKKCSVVFVGKSEQLPASSSINLRELHKSSEISRAASSVQKQIFTKTKIEKPSPTRVLNGLDGESQSTEEDEEDESSSSTADSFITESPASSLGSKLKGESKLKKQLSSYKVISSIFRSPFEWSGRKRNEGLGHKKKEQPLLKCFSYEEISKATNNFHPDNLVGQGGYSEVYRGDLQDGKTIAVKRLTKDNNTNENKEKEFLMELGILGHVFHPNTAKLVGCCIENGLHLIFNFSPNGTLASALHGKGNNSLEWPERYKIAIGIARGLHYLHKCCKHRIIHRDIKASNVLLGPDYEPQISDFGLAKWLPNKWTHHAVIPIEGTFGYLAPEYFMHGIVDEKTDVFSYGVLLLEIITGRRAVDSSKQNLLQWAKPLMESGKIAELADPKLREKYDMNQMHKVVLTASYCVRQSSIWRPTMNEVLELLTNGHNSDAARSRRIPKFTSDDMDDYSMVYGYEIPIDIILEDLCK